MALHFVTWKWHPGRAGYSNLRVPYGASHVNRLVANVTGKLSLPHRFVCVTDDPQGIRCDAFPLWGDCDGLVNMSGQHFPSCYRRLKLFDPATQAAMGINPGDRIVSIDLDMLPIDDLDPLFVRDGDFVAWVVKGKQKPQVVNGSLWMFTAGACEWMWTEFDPAMSPRKARLAGYLGSDQSWMSLQLAERGMLSGWSEYDSGVISYSNVIRKLRGKLPPPATRLIVFHGPRKPWGAQAQAEAPWIRATYEHGDRPAAYATEAEMQRLTVPRKMIGRLQRRMDRRARMAIKAGREPAVA